MGVVVIGIDPHKASHTAVAVDEREVVLGQLRVPASTRQCQELRRWAARWPERRWAVEGAHGLGRLLSQQLLAAGEQVVDVQPKSAARIRLLDTGAVNKNDPNDARSVAIAALRSSTARDVTVDDNTAVLRMWARRQEDLGSAYTRTACRLHAVLCELVPGGFAKEITVGQAETVLDGLIVSTAVDIARMELARDLVEDLRRVHQQRLQLRRRLAKAVAATNTTVTDITGVGPVVAATVLGFVGDIRRFPTRDHFAAYNGTAPIEASSGPRTIHRLSLRGNRHLNHVIHIAAVSQLRYPGPGRDYYDRKRAEGMPAKSALRALKRRISDSLYTRMVNDARRARQRLKDPGGQTGNDSSSSATGSHPATPALRRSHSRASANTKTEPSPKSRARTQKPRGKAS